MKVYLFPKIAKKETGEGGIRRVLEAITQYLPERGVEFVNSMSEADLVNVHADSIDTKGLPVVASNHGLYWTGHEWEAWAYKANEKLINLMKRATTKAITVPSFWVANSLRRGMLLDPFIVPHGIDTEFWVPQETGSYVLWAKNRKDHICDPTPLNYLASKFPKQQFVTTFGKPAPNTTVLGRVPLERIKPIIQSAGVYLASVEETGGITVLEAMSCGVPALASRKGANLEIVIHGETGYLYDPDNLQDLEEGLHYCLQHRERMGVNARQYVLENRKWEHVIDGYIDAYQYALQPQRKPKVSVVITAYNYEDVLPRSIASVLEQDFDDWELIIVNDHSPDQCGKIADKYAEQDERIKVVHNRTNLYLTEARNKGFRLATGEYFLALDADDALPSYALRVLSAELDRDPDTHIVTGAMALIEEDGREWVSSWPWDTPDYEHQIMRKNQVPYSSMYRRDVWERTGGYRRRMKTAEDAEFWTRAMSFGALPRKITPKPTLIYSNHSDSMSHTEAPVVWNAWFPWSYLTHMVPYGTSGRKETPYEHVLRYGPAQISVIIPVGPGHDILLQDCLDSLVAQSFVNWEVIVVNDTGESWVDENGKLNNPYLQGFPFVQIVNVDSHKPKGTAWARNRGIEHANAPYITFLDADDFLQIPALDLMYKTLSQFGGWVYIDWYDQEGTHKKADEWTEERLLVRAVGPITGLYKLQDIKLVGGFDESLAGWEDWDLHLSLYTAGICGSRLPVPLLTYRYHTGMNRERDFNQKADLLDTIRNKHKNLLQRGETFMGCKKCPGGGGRKNLSVSRRGTNAAMSKNKETTAPQEEELVEIVYMGAPAQKRRIRSKVKPRVQYTYSKQNNRFYVFRGDAEWMTAMGDFDYMKEEATILPAVEQLDVEKLETARTPEPEPEVPTELPLEVLPLPQEVITILRNNYPSVNSLRQVSAAQLVLHKGIGPKRAEAIQKAVNDVLSG